MQKIKVEAMNGGSRATLVISQGGKYTIIDSDRNISFDTKESMELFLEEMTDLSRVWGDREDEQGEYGNYISI